MHNRFRVCAAVAAMLCAGAVGAEVPEGFAVMGDRIKDFPPPAAFVATPSVEKRLPPPASKEDEASGCMIYARCPEQAVWRESTPELDEIADTVRIFATPGEYEPWVVCVYGLRETKGLRAEVTALTGPKGAVIPRDHLDLRVQNYVWRATYGTSFTWQPGFLEHQEAVDLPAEESRAYWVTVKVPDAATPGVYEGTLSLSAGGRTRVVKLLLRVLPFTLDRAPYMGSMLTPSFQIYDEVFGKDTLHEKLVDLREHGHGDAFGYFTFYPALRGGPAEKPELDFTVAPMNCFFSCDEIVAAMRKAKVWGPIYVNRGGAGIANLAGRYGPDKYPQAVVSITRAWMEYARTHDYPPMYIGYGDEPEHSAKDMQRARDIFRMLREGGASPTSYLLGPYQGIDSGALFYPYMETVCLNSFTPGILEDMRLRRQRLWLYNVGLGRFEHGWQCIATGAELVTHYDYQTWGAPDRGAFKYCAAAADAVTKKPIPSAAWEMAREGMDDARYFATLWNWIGRAETSRDEGAMRAAAEARKFLKATLDRIPLDRFALRDWQQATGFSKRDLEKVRWQMATHVLALRASLEKQLDQPWCR